MASNWLFHSEEPCQENAQKPKHEELFVFGYGCKIFRDDDQANLVDAGKYLIPWMGDERLQIDRYDGRGHLYDLTPYDADLRKGPREELSEDEKKIEALCDEERYLELHTDLTEKSMYEEEEWKRYYESLSEGYKAVGFSYDHYGQPYGYTDEVVKEEDPEEQPYVPHPDLHLPKGVQIPLTNKEAAIVEKTAKFIASHGMQMEIMMKTKQANNPKFLFMHFEDPLHPYYRHVVKMIKSGKFKPVFEEVKQEEPDHDDEAGGDGDDHHSYLHPTLLQTNRASPTPEVYKPVQIQMPKVSIHETSYGQLLKSLSKVNQEVAEKMKPKETVKTEPQDDSGLPACMAQPVFGPPVSSHNGVPPPPGIEPVTLPQNDENQDGEEKGDGSSPMDHSHLAHIVPPPPDIQPVVDRMAMYVAKNGVEFEIVVKSKNDARFEFLHPHHVHFAYYDFKKQLFIKELEREKKEKEKEKEEQEELEEEQENEEKEKSSSGVGIKFKVKMKGKEQEALTLDKKKVFENESSDEEDQDGERSERERSGKSGSSTPVVENTHIPSAKADVDPATAERKLAEQRMRDRIAASAREKLSQVDKEKQLQAERKRKAAMFINMLKGGNSDSGSGVANDIDVSERLSAQTPSGTSTPASSEKSSSGRQKSKSKHKRKDKRRSRSRERSRSRSRERRSRSKSSSRSKKKKRKRSPTPPSAYAVTRRSPLHFPPPPPPRYQNRDRSPSNSRSSRHISRSPSNSRSSRYRSKSKSPVRSKSKKKRKSRSQSPSRSKSKDSKSHKTKKKKKKRSKSRSPTRKGSRLPSADPEIKKVDSSVSIQSMQSEDRVSTPVAVESELEEGETRETTPEPEEVKKEQLENVSSPVLRRSLTPSDVKSKRSRSRTRSKSRSFSPVSVKSDKSDRSPPTSRHSSVSRHSSQGNRSSRSRSRHSSRSSSRHSSRDSLRRSRSRSPKKRSKSPRKQSLSPKERSRSPEANKSSSAPIPSCPASPDKDSDCDSLKSGTSTPKAATGAGTQKNVSQYMLNRVRAIIKASREAILKEDGPFLNDS